MQHRFLLALSLLLASCGSSTFACPDGSVPADGRCVPSDAGSLSDAGSPDDASADGTVECRATDLDCDGDASTPCETDTTSNRNHCGACGLECPWGCADGECASPTQVVTGFQFTCALFPPGNVACWGVNARGSLGTGQSSMDVPTSPTPVMVRDVDGTGRLRGVKKLTTSLHRVCALMDSGEVVCWGTWDGTGTATPLLPGLLPDVRDASDVFLPSNVATVCVVQGPAGQLECWGESIIDGGFDPDPEAVADSDGDVVTGPAQLSGGLRFGCIRDAGVRCWGENYDSQLGAGLGPNETSAVALSVRGVGGAGALMDVEEITSSYHTTCARLTTGELVSWGSAEFVGPAPLGGGEPADASAGPIAVLDTTGEPDSQFTGATSLGSNYMGNCAIRNGQAFCWGENYTGSAGTGETRVPAFYPTAVVGVDGEGTLTGVAHLSRGMGRHMCAALDDGNVVCWGDNEFGQLGNGTAGDPIPYPVLVTPPPH